MSSSESPSAQGPDAYSPAEIARRVRDVGATKANLGLWSLFLLSALAGAFIALGGCFSTLTLAGLQDTAFGIQRLLAGITFSLGLILVILAGAELFTGNNLIIMGWASGSVSTRLLLRNWFCCYLGNWVGAIGTALLFFWSGAWRAADYEPASVALRIAAHKVELEFVPAFFLGVLCNALVCLAVWLCFGARSTVDKIAAILFPITAFVALGFEHSIANMYFLAIGWLLRASGGAVTASGLTPEQIQAIDLAGAIGNLVPVTLGNIVGGAGLVAGVYWLIYLRPARPRPAL